LSDLRAMFGSRRLACCGPPPGPMISAAAARVHATPEAAIMAERITKTQRWLDLIVFLLRRQFPVSVEQIMEGVHAYAVAWSTEEATARASVRRMFERDKDELRRMGIPIESVRYSINHGMETAEGYRLARRDFYLPYLRVVGAGTEEQGGGGSADRGSGGSESIELTIEEARVAVEALRQVRALPSFPFVAEANTALGKLGFDLDPDRYPATPVVWVERPGEGEVLAHLRVLSDALLAGKRVRFRYHGIQRGEATDREVAPYGLFMRSDWYLVGHDTARDAVRVFRVSRMAEPEAVSRTAAARDFEVPEDFELREYAERRPWDLDDERPVEAEVRFRFPASLWAERNGEGELVREEGEGAAVRRFEVRAGHPFLRWVLGFAGEAEVVSPPELVEAQRTMVDEIVARYRGDDGTR
jgi:proteasome accessory factor B